MIREREGHKFRRGGEAKLDPRSLRQGSEKFEN